MALNQAKLMLTLTPSESKRLIAKAVAALPQVQKALEKGRIIIANGTTNAYIVEEITGQSIEDKYRYTAGIVTDGVACVTPAASRLEPVVLINGAQVKRGWTEVLEDFTADDVFIKGANAIDIAGNVGILLGGKGGGTIGKAIGYLCTVGSHLIIPVGLEKLIPSVSTAAAETGTDLIDFSLGLKCGLMILNTGLAITEIEAVNVLFGLEAIQIAAGGVGGSEGAVTLLVQGHPDKVERCMEFIKRIKGEQLIAGTKRPCTHCPEPCQR